MRTVLSLALIAIGASLAAAPALAQAPTSATTATPAIHVFRPVAIKGRLSKPSVTFILGRSFHAPTTLMSEDLWREKTAKLAASGVR